MVVVVVPRAGARRTAHPHAWCAAAVAERRAASEEEGVADRQQCAETRSGHACRQRYVCCLEGQALCGERRDAASC